MKISKIYTNQAKKFSQINFKLDGLNIIFGAVKDPLDKESDSHNLGKTTLAELIDYLMLKGKSPACFLFKHEKIFSSFIFFFEIQLKKHTFLTIRRSVQDNSKISFKKHSIANQDFTNIDDSDWDHFQIPLAKSKILMDSFLEFKALSPWQYRNGLSYFLRTQADYSDVFQLSKFKGKHEQWKPYLFHILGFSVKDLQEKYSVDEEIETREAQLSLIKKDYPGDVESLDNINGMIVILEQKINDKEEALEAFDFYFEETKLQKNLIEQVESKISRLNKLRYDLTFELDNISKHLSSGNDFDLDSIEKIFNESSLYFENQLKKEYKDLIQFNKIISTERKGFLVKQAKVNTEEIKSINKELKRLNFERKMLLSVLKESDALAKYKQLEKTLIESKSKIEFLQQKKAISEKNATILHKIKLLKKERDSYIEKIIAAVNEKNEIYRAVRLAFNKIVRSIINEDAVISIKINDSGNPEFNAELVDSSGISTSQSKGTSYKRLLCVAFDLSLLMVHSEENFFHFAYHDGILEGLDNRKKEKLISLTREICKEHNIQPIITVIDSDWPTNSSGEKYEFNKEEIVKHLHDQGREGRLFQMPEF